MRRLKDGERGHMRLRIVGEGLKLRAHAIQSLESAAFKEIELRKEDGQGGEVRLKRLRPLKRTTGRAELLIAQVDGCARHIGWGKLRIALKRFGDHPIGAAEIAHRHHQATKDIFSRRIGAQAMSGLQLTLAVLDVACADEDRALDSANARRFRIELACTFTRAEPGADLAALSEVDKRFDGDGGRERFMIFEDTRAEHGGAAATPKDIMLRAVDLDEIISETSEGIGRWDAFELEHLDHARVRASVRARAGDGCGERSDLDGIGAAIARLDIGEELSG